MPNQTKPANVLARINLDNANRMPEVALTAMQSEITNVLKGLNKDRFVIPMIKGAGK